MAQASDLDVRIWRETLLVRDRRVQELQRELVALRARWATAVDLRDEAAEQLKHVVERVLDPR